MKPINTWSEIKPGDVVMNHLDRQLYVACSVGLGYSIATDLVHKDNYFKRTRYTIEGDELYYSKVSCKSIKSWDDVPNHTKVVCMDPVEYGCVNEVLISQDGEMYLSSASQMWPIYQFNHRDWRTVEPDCDAKIEGE